MASKLKWLFLTCLILAGIVGGAYGMLLWEQGKIFDREAVTHVIEIDGVNYSFDTTVTKKSLFGRQFTLSQTVQNTPLMTYRGTVSFGFTPKAVMRIQGVPSIPIFEQGILNSSTVITAYFNIRFFPERVILRSDATSLEIPGGGEILFGEMNMVGRIYYSSAFYEKHQVLDKIDLNFISDNYSDPNVKLGPIEFNAVYTPGASKFLTMDLSLRETALVNGDFKMSSLSFKSDISKSDGDFTDTFMISAQGTEKFNSPISIHADVGVTYPDRINFHGILAKVFLNRGLPNFSIEKDLKEFVKALREGFATIVINDASYNNKVFTFGGRGLIGASEGKPDQWAKLNLSLTTDHPEQLQFFRALLPKNSVKREPKGISSEVVVREAGKKIVLYGNGQRLYEFNIDPLLKQLYR